MRRFSRGFVNTGRILGFQSGANGTGYAVTEYDDEEEEERDQ